MNMDKNNEKIARMSLLTTLGLGGIAFVYGMDSPLIAASVSFISLAINCAVGQLGGYFS